MADVVEKKGRLTRDDWIEAATQLLIKRSIDAVRVEPLAKDLNVSRGSFYWHFKKRQELLEAILGNWRERQTRRIVERIRDARSLSPEEQLTKLRMLPARSKATREAAALELAIRAWARRDRFAKHAVEAVDNERVEFTKELLTDAGGDPATARTWALLGHAYILGESLLRETMSDDEIEACRTALLDAQFAALQASAAKTRRPKAASKS